MRLSINKAVTAYYVAVALDVTQPLSLPLPLPQQHMQRHTLTQLYHQLSYKITNLPFFQRRQLVDEEEVEEAKNWYSVLNAMDPDRNNRGHPRLGNRWPEYQGANDWAGLLDPLDDHLRSEILRYGDFNEAAYRAFEFDPTSPSYGSCRFPKRTLLDHAGFPDTGYRLTRNLRATSGIKLPGWAGSSWAAMESSWIGYVAVCQDKAEIARLGRRDVVISLRGTATCHEWLENLRATLAPVPGADPGDDPASIPMVETGFLSLYTSGLESLRDAIRDEVSRILELYSDEPLSITLTGHSLGAALATLAAYDIKTTFERAPIVTVMSFGGPRVGNRSFRSLVEKKGIKILRIVNPNDLITKVPGFIIDNEDDDDEEENHNCFLNTNRNINNPLAGFRLGFGFEFKFEHGFESWPEWIQKTVEDTQTQWVYAEVGCELRLDCEEPKYEINLAKCHDLKTYLQLVKGLSRMCPFRASASRFIKRVRTPAPA